MTEVILGDQSLREGLQFEQQVLTLEEKVSIFGLLAAAGMKRVQVGSFVHPKIVPQMADTDRLIHRLQDTADVVLSALILSESGLKRALVSGIGHVCMSISVSDAHSRRNVRRSARQSLAGMIPLISKAVDAGLTVRANTQCSFGCVYEGDIPEDIVLDAMAAMAQAGASEINLADTTGMANPMQVKRLVGKVKAVLNDLDLSLHLHDTRGLGLANMVAGFEAGVREFDVAAGGLGGCPFVRGASGNVATEDAVNLFDQMGVETGIDLEALCRVVGMYESLLGRRLPGKLCGVLKIMGSSC